MVESDEEAIMRLKERMKKTKADRDNIEDLKDAIAVIKDSLEVQVRDLLC